MSDKSYVTMEVCPICNKDTGNILMDKRIRPVFESKTINPTNPCDECKEKYLSIGVMLINPETGSLAIIKDKTFSIMFNQKVPKHKIAFVDEELIQKIISKR